MNNNSMNSSGNKTGQVNLAFEDSGDKIIAAASQRNTAYQSPNDSAAVTKSKINVNNGLAGAPTTITTNTNDNIVTLTSEQVIGTKSSLRLLHPVRSFQSYIRPNAQHKTCKQKCSQVFHQYLGIVLTLLTSFVMSLGTFLVQILQKEGYSPFLTTFWRFVGVLVPAIPTLIYFQWYSKQKVLSTVCPVSKEGHWIKILLIIFRAVVGTGGFVLQYYALNYITLADTSVISFSSPVFAIFLGRICLKESCGIVPTILALLTIIGVTIIAKPPFIFGGEELTAGTLTGIGLASAACLANTLVFVSLRFLKDVHFSIISIVFGFIGLSMSLILAYCFEELQMPRTWQHTLLFLSTAIIGFIGQVGLTFALKYEEAGIVSAFRTSDVIFSFLWQILIGVIPTIYSVLGALLVVMCVSLLAFRKWLMLRKKDDSCAHNLWFLLK